jgi:hypothetical protein
VQRTVRNLETKKIVRVDENFKSRVEKYTQRFCNSRFSDYQFDPPQLAIVCLLLLRGPQTPGELRGHSGRLHSFADKAAVADALAALIDRDAEPLVVELPRTPGRKDAEYIHLFSGPVDINVYARQARTAITAGAPGRVSVFELELRVNSLEAEVAELKKRLKTPF